MGPVRYLFSAILLIAVLAGLSPYLDGQIRDLVSAADAGTLEPCGPTTSSHCLATYPATVIDLSIPQDRDSGDTATLTVNSAFDETYHGHGSLGAPGGLYDIPASEPYEDTISLDESVADEAQDDLNPTSAVTLHAGDGRVVSVTAGGRTFFTEDGPSLARPLSAIVWIGCFWVVLVAALLSSALGWMSKAGAHRVRRARTITLWIAAAGLLALPLALGISVGFLFVADHDGGAGTVVLSGAIGGALSLAVALWITYKVRKDRGK